jgi:hypothetical protein
VNANTVIFAAITTILSAARNIVDMMDGPSARFIGEGHYTDDAIALWERLIAMNRGRLARA